MAVTITKEAGGYLDNCLRITCTAGISGSAVQAVLTAGNTYRVAGFARSNGVRVPSLGDLASVFWRGSSSTDWQSIDVIFIATSTMIFFNCDPNVSAGYVEFDTFNIINMTDSCDSWSIGNDALVSKLQDDPYAGNQYMRVKYNATSYPYAYQTVLAIGVEYHLVAHARGNGIDTTPMIKDGANILWQGTTSNNWQAIDLTFTAISTDLEIYAHCIATGHADFDHMSLTDLTIDARLDLVNLGAINECSPYGRNFLFPQSSYLMSSSMPIIDSKTFTFAFVCKIANTDGIEVLLTHDDINEPIKCWVETDRIRFKLYDGTEDHEISCAIDKAWACIVCKSVYDGINTTFSIYKNGVLESTDVFKGVQADVAFENLHIGKNTVAISTPKISNGLYIFNGPKTDAWVESFNSIMQAQINNLSDALAYSSLTEIDGGHYTGINGIELSDPVIDNIYRTYCYAKVFSTYAKPTIPGIYQFIQNTFNKKAEVYSVATGYVTVELHEYFTGFERVILRNYAPISAGMNLEIINWPYET